MAGAYLAEIWSYPVKSLRGGSHDAAQINPWGLEQDRRWMTVDTAGRFITQREHPGMATIQAHAHGDALALSAAGAAPLMVPTPPRVPAGWVRIWRDRVEAVDCGEAAAAWLSARLGVTCRLVHLADTSARKLGADYARDAAECVSFADGFPVLLTSRASLADLNARLAAPVPMSRFRANLVIEGAFAWEEDRWQRVQIGKVRFRVGKPCERCIMTTIDQATGERPNGDEPLVGLGRFRRNRYGKILFGQNLIPETSGEVNTADEIHPSD